MFKYLLSFVFMFPYFLSIGQLLAPINGNTLPKDADKICYIPFYTGSFEASGYQNNDLLPDFTIFDLNGNSFNLKSELAKGKPVLIMGGNITCPVFRDKINEFNALCTKYGNQINPIIVYGIEAHPDIDTSIYFGKVNTGNRNFSDNILFRQPTTYGERKELLDTLLAKFTLAAPVYIDQPCNEWWSKFGPAPNNAYLIDTNGRVFSKHGWFNKFPNNMACDIDSILHLPSSCASSNNPTGTFQFKSMAGEDTAIGTIGSTLYAKGTIRNNSSQNVVIQITRKQIVTPNDWTNSMCIIQCLAETDDQTTVELIPNQMETFSVDFFTSNNSGKGSVQVEFKNVNSPTNIVTKWFFAETFGSANSPINDKSNMRIYPNPAVDELFVKRDINIPVSYQITDLNGRTILYGHMIDKLDISQLTSGIYILTLTEDGGVSRDRFIVR
jgi:hypothetical protein